MPGTRRSGGSWLSRSSRGPARRSSAPLRRAPCERLSRFRSSPQLPGRRKLDARSCNSAPAARRRTLRARSLAAVPFRRDLVRLLDAFAPRDADAFQEPRRSARVPLARRSPKASGSSGASRSCAPARSSTGSGISSRPACCSRSSSSRAARGCPEARSACSPRSSAERCSSARWCRPSPGAGSPSDGSCCSSSGPGACRCSFSPGRTHTS